MKNNIIALSMLIASVVHLYAAELPEKQVPSAPTFEEFQAAMQESPEMQASPEREEASAAQAQSSMQPQPSAPPENIFVHKKPASLTESEDRALIDEGLEQALAAIQRILAMNQAFLENTTLLSIRNGLEALKAKREKGQLDAEQYRQQLASLVQAFGQFLEEVAPTTASAPPASAFESDDSSSEDDTNQAASSSTSSWYNFWGWLPGQQ